MDWSDIGRSIAAVAPTIAGAIGGIAGNLVLPGAGGIAGNVLASRAVTAILDALGISPDLPEADKQAAVEQALASGKPEVLLALKQADQAFLKEMRSLDVEVERIDAADRDSARRRQIEVRDKVPSILAFALTGGFFAALGTLFMVPVTEPNREAVYLLLGSLGTVWLSAMTFYFGTTRQSAQKNAAMAEIAKVGAAK